MALYNDTTARSAGGQNFTIILPDNTKLTFTLNVTTTAAAGTTSLVAIGAPSWSGGAFGNSAFLGITGSPILYTSTPGSGTTSTVKISNIALTAPDTSTVTAYSFVVADGESTAKNTGTGQVESISLSTDGTGWKELDQVGAVGSLPGFPILPTESTLGLSTLTWTGNAGDPVGAYVVSSDHPKTISATLTPIGGKEGVLFAVRFASIRLNKQIVGARVNAADQFKFDINITSGGTNLATGLTSGTGNGPFTAAAASVASGLGLTLVEGMATGSVSTLSHYNSVLNCTNATTGSTTPLPSNVTTTSYNFGSLSFGDAVQCTFTNTSFPHLQLTKALGGTRRVSGDQFVMNINAGATNLATTTTTGTGSTISTGATPQTQVTAGSSYTLSEASSGTTVLGQYNAVSACTNANASSTTVLPTSVPLTLTPVMGDVISCTITNTPISANGVTTVAKTLTVISDPINGIVNPRAIPGAIVKYTITVTKTGVNPTVNNSIFIVDSLPTNISYNGGSPVVFTDGSPASGIPSFNPSTDATFSSSTPGAPPYTSCGAPFTYSPSAGYDPAVKGICINPKGTMAGATAAGQPSFSVSFLTQIK
jgi:hypothetical protein